MKTKKTSCNHAWSLFIFIALIQSSIGTFTKGVKLCLKKSPMAAWGW